MKKTFLFLVTLLSCLLAFSCKLSDDSKGSLVVQNESENENIYITSVYAMEKESSGYQLVWTGEIKNESSEFIQLEPGKYSVKIAVENRTYSPFVSTEYSTTGYNVYVQLIEDGFVNAIFDGKGIYFE